MPRRLKIFSRCQGSAAVEFAIVLPVLMLILAGLIEFGWAFYWQHTTTNASRAGARYAVQAQLDSGGVKKTYTDAEIQALVDKYGAGLIAVVDRSAGNASGATRSVEVTKTMQWLFVGYLQSMGVPLPSTVHTTTWMTME